MFSRTLFVIVFPLALSGCAEILGLDTGEPTTDDAGLDMQDLASEAGASSDAAVTADVAVVVDDTPDAESAPDAFTLVCPAGKADCNGIEKDGCETNLNDPSNCGSCTYQCPPLSACKSEVCCLSPHATCTSDEQCCSGDCGGVKGCH